MARFPLSKQPPPSILLRELRKKGVRFSAGALDAVDSYCRDAKKRGRIKNKKEYDFAKSVLILSGSQKAVTRNSKIVQNSDISQGWQAIRGKAGGCPGNMPPHLCLRRSIISRKKELIRDMPLLAEFFK